MAFQEFDGELDKPASFVEFNGKLDDDKPNVMSKDLPLGILETLTTGAAGALGSLVSGVGGAIAGAIDPTYTAKEGWNDASQRFSQSAIGKELAPQTESGKAIEHLIGQGIESFKDYAGDPTQSPLKLVPFAGDALANSPVGAAAGALASAAPELGMVPMLKMGTNRVVKTKEAPTKPDTQGALQQLVSKEEPKQKAPIAEQTNETSQLPLFEQDQLGQQRSPYQVGKGDWRVDENGIPIRADLSMEASNVQAPLQRGLWGDELGPGLGNERSLTEAIDSIEPGIRNRENGKFAPGTTRETAIDRLTGEVAPGNDLLAAKQQADGSLLPFDEQAKFQPTNPLETKTLGELEQPTVAPTIAKEAEVLQGVPGIKEKLGELVPDNFTPEQAIEVAKTGKDVDQNFVQKAANYFTKGGLYQALKTHNPVVKFAQEKVIKADQLARADIATYIHDKNTGLAPAMRDLSSLEKTQVWNLMDMADKMQKELTPDFLKEHGFNEKQIALVERHRQVMDYAFEQLNKAREAAGKEPIDKRTAYAAMRSTGDYRRLVYNADKEVVGVIGSDFKWKVDSLKKNMEEKGYTVGEQRYYGGVPRERGSAQQAFLQAIEFLAENDPKAKEFLNVLDEVTTSEAYNFLNMKSHTMDKKGVGGMEGRKSWKSAEANALEGLQAQLNYAESAIKWGHISEAAREVNSVLNSKDVNMPVAKKWAEQYLQNAMGFNPSSVGRSLELAVAEGVGKTGIGYSNVRTTMAVARKAANTILLGLNPLFWYTNIMQPFASMPGVMAYLQTKGLSKNFDLGTGYSYLANGSITALRETSASSKLSAFEKDMIKYAKDRHVYGSDLVEHSNRASKDASYWLDKVGGAASASIESSSRRVVFFGIAHMLKENGMRVKDGLFETAQNITDMAMNNYSATERPQAYNAMGPLGDMAVNLSSYKHNELSRLALFARQIGEEKSMKPVMTQLATGVAFAGITGSLAFAEADWLYKQITKAMGKPDSLSAMAIRASETISSKAGLKGDNQYGLSHGMFSFLGADMSKRLGLSDVIPDTLVDAAFPGGSKLVDATKAGYNAITDPSEMNTKRAIRELSPGAITGAEDRAWFSKKTPQGELGLSRNKLEGQVLRTDKDKFWKSIGGTGINESVQKQKLFEAEWIKQSYSDMRKKPLAEARDQLFTEGKVRPETVQKYLKLEGDINTLTADIQKMAKEQNIPAATLAQLSSTMSQSITSLRNAERIKEMFKKQ